MAELWKNKNLAEKILLIAIAVHLLGFFFIPMAELSASAELLSRVASAFGVDEMPKNLTRFAYMKISMKDAFLPVLLCFGVFPALDALCLYLAAKRDGRMRYLTILLIYFLVVFSWGGVTLQIATSMRGYSICLGTVILAVYPILLAALSLICLLTFDRLRTGAQKAEKNGAQIPLESGERMVIGRDAKKASLVLTDPTVSGAHCSISYDAGSGQYQVTDHSENGTFLENGKRLPKDRPVKLPPGSLLVIGSDRFQVG